MSTPILPGPTGSSVTLPWSLANLPSSPNAADDEFSGALSVNTTAKTITIGSAQPWTYYTNGAIVDPTVVTQIDATATPAGAWNLDATSRPSCIRVQPAVSGNATSVVLYKSFTPSMGQFVYARMFNSWRVGTNNVSDGLFEIGLYDGPISSYTHRVRVAIQSDVNANNALIQVDNAAAFEFQQPGNWPLMEYIGLLVDPSVAGRFHGYACTANGSWVYLVTVNLAFSPSVLALSFGNSSSSAPGASVIGTDFERVHAGLP